MAGLVLGRIERLKVLWSCVAWREGCFHCFLKVVLGSTKTNVFCFNLSVYALVNIKKLCSWHTDPVVSEGRLLRMRLHFDRWVSLKEDVKSVRHLVLSAVLMGSRW